MRHYPPIAEHGLIGDLQTCALVSSSGVLNWFCSPRFDSPSIFAGLLDHARGGYFAITADAPALTGDDPGNASAQPGVTTRQLYLADTAVLITRFLTPEGVGEVVDFMPVHEPHTVTDRHQVVRFLRVVRGTVRFTLECRPRFDYGRQAHGLALDGATAHFEGPGTTAHLQAVGPVPLEADGDDVRATITLKAGEHAAVTLTVCDTRSAAPPLVTMADMVEKFTAVRRFWHGWIGRSRYGGRWQQMVNRSAITLKLLTYAPTSAPIAAATMGLPEQEGGERNWDYRYTWVRDASLSVRAMRDLGFTEEANAFRSWLGQRLKDGPAPNGEPLQIMYRLDGDPYLDEEVLHHLEGWRASAPVRAGNGAVGQLQLDIYGEAVYALAQAGQVSDVVGYDGWQRFAGLLDWLCENWDRPDEGIWETRGGQKDFTYSRLMCWVAFDRGIRQATANARPADLIRWTTARDTIMDQIMTRGWSEERRAFVQHYGSTVLDASLLLMPLVGFIAPTDPRWLSTLDAMATELVSDSLVYRYDPAASPDGLRGSEGTFSLCSFLFVYALARAGRLEEARYAFDKMLTYANHVGLFAEEIGPTGEQLGNFPQAFTHLALITAALALDTEIDQATSRTQNS
ncbi:MULTISPECIES: glycoside hydrolase family 15 protein [unclassified Streptomyces]|uniref:glycoside hydrolase family 15 protein n=1 Tax=unclassified Streptomyces TaxID=2593676 RepID=UPI000DC7B3EA|nr:MULTISPECIES: glycoside hydrolase family 15 protein [unclassified Streptomyces]AWZ03602.1 glycoside hydrolase family 15 protein [Streptomyces sp. ICC4]AWZ10999.1 glycoside hydrolase family 15 protein [Streptomyces sp. ICC1]